MTVAAAVAVMTAVVPLSVLAAGMTFRVRMLVVIAACLRIIDQLSLGQGFCRFIRGARHAAVERDACLGKSCLCAHADATADQRVCLGSLQKACQRAVPGAVGGNDLRGYDLPVRDVIELELLRVSEMLEDLTVFVSDCDSFHDDSFPGFPLN